MPATPPQSAFEQLVLDLSPRYGTGEATSIARIVFEDAFGTRRPHEKQFSSEEETLFLAIRQRLLAGEPLQYVLGVADFWGLKFKVSPAVLIPRQETEELVAQVRDWLRLAGNTAAKVLDIGIGSGCIGIALKKEMPQIQLFGLEKSPDALSVATENAHRLLGDSFGTFVLGDVLRRDSWQDFPPLDLVVSNPPYIPQRERSLMPEHVLAYEPALALFVEDSDPLLFYRTIALLAREKLRPRGALFFECNEFNATEVVRLLNELDFSEARLQQDLSGADRIVWATWLPER